MANIAVSDKAKGFVSAILAAVFFGFIPLFGKPALSAGMATECVLAYRFGMAAVMLFCILKIKKIPIRIPVKQIPAMLLIAVAYSFSGGFLMLGFNYMSGGVAEVIHFTYPIWVMLIMITVFREKISFSSITAIILAISGIYCLGVLGSEESFLPNTNKLAGVIIVLISGLACATFMVTINKSKCSRFHSLTISFWMLVLSALFFLVISAGTNTLQIAPSAEVFLNLLALAFVATVLSNFFLVYSIKGIGSTLSAILGALEPVTGVVSCAIVFGEAITAPIVFGIILILTAVLIVILRKK